VGGEHRNIGIQTHVWHISHTGTSRQGSKKNQLLQNYAAAIIERNVRTPTQG
jgi:hypothetical protein